MIGLGRSLGMLTTAEGVETEEQLSQLRTESCNEVQGYLFSPPVDPSLIPQLLERWNGIVVLGKRAPASACASAGVGRANANRCDAGASPALSAYPPLRPGKAASRRGLLAALPGPCSGKTSRWEGQALGPLRLARAYGRGKLATPP